MLDFTSALYLGLRHPSAVAAPLVGAHDGQAGGAGDAGGCHASPRKLAALQGCEARDAAPFDTASVLGPVRPSRT